MVQKKKKNNGTHFAPLYVSVLKYLMVSMYAAVEQIAVCKYVSCANLGRAALFDVSTEVQSAKIVGRSNIMVPCANAAMVIDIRPLKFFVFDRWYHNADTMKLHLITVMGVKADTLTNV